jgi:hypothetical protein
MTLVFRDRSKAATFSRNVATKRMEEVLVETWLQETMGEPGTPCKKVFWSILVYYGAIDY